ncbi:hypothetical protein RZS28_01150 [Methylocapsa polymorpha]|uniref:Uncharacterized protein n=1 Tax=Methylocapsa polymorpha TaxID=3080828 RepID=A0ABZ0HSR6_9HYPH|nr:hypothetical protein RZS28_01150 [Methylocapsa sp. RX1]
MPDPNTTAKTVAPPPWQWLKLPAAVRWLRETISIVLWLGLFIHWFIVDLRPWTVSYIQLPEWIYTFRFLIILGLISAFLLVLGARRFVLFFGYIGLYPFVVLLWHLPIMGVRNWALLVAFAPAIYSTVIAFKWRFALFTAALACGAIILWNNSKVLWNDSNLIVIGAMFYLGFYLVLHFVRRFNVAFSPDTVFATWISLIQHISARIKNDAYRRPKELDLESKEYQQKVTQNLIAMYVTSGCLLYIANGLRRVSKSRKLDIYFISSLINTFLLATVVFALEYYGLERTYPGSFVGIINPSFSSFFGLSFSTILPSGISPLVGATNLAQMLRYAEHLSSILVLVLFAFVILTSIRERHKEDLDKVVNELSNTSESIRSFLLENYELTTAAVESWIFKHSPAIMKPLLRLRYDDAAASEIIEALENAAGDAGEVASEVAIVETRFPASD